MNTIKIDAKSTRMIAHRGLSGLEPENTIAAFIAAGNRSYYGVETDVHVTKDGKFVVIHDDHTRRVSGVDVTVEETTYDELRNIQLYNTCRLDLEGSYGDRLDLCIPSLAEYINICKKYEKVCVLELKNPFAPADIERMIEEIKELEYLENMVFISFSLENMIELRRLLPKQELYFLTSVYSEELHQTLRKHQLYLDIEYRQLTKENIAALQNDGIKVNCWTCDSKEAAEDLVSWGIDFITTNILE